MGVKSGFSSLPTAVFIAQIFHYICQWGQANKLKQTKEGENPRELAGGKLVRSRRFELGTSMESTEQIQQVVRARLELGASGFQIQCSKRPTTSPTH